MISVIVPIYNVAPYLAQCLESVRRQTYSDWQAILVNDGSTDESAVIAQQFVQEDSRFRLVNRPNGGLSAARNTGLEHATGEYITFIDADDYIDVEYLETLLCHAEGVELVQSGFRRIDNAGRVLRRVYPRPSYRLVSACFRLYRRTLIEEHRMVFATGQYYEDVLFSIDLWLTHPKTCTIDYTGYNYRVNDTSITSRRHDTTYVFNYLRRKQKETTALRDRWIVWYTRLRLRAHFILNR